MKQAIVTLDMEGVLTPEIWIAVAEKTGVANSGAQRDEPDYDKLMRYRLAILDREGIKLSDIQNVIGSLSLLPGGPGLFGRPPRPHPGHHLVGHVRAIRRAADPAVGLADPVLSQTGRGGGPDPGYELRVPDQKKKAVAALKSLNYRVVAAGDSFNDTAMLMEADTGFLFHAPPNVVRQFPQFPAVDTYAELSARLLGALDSGSDAGRQGRPAGFKA